MPPKREREPSARQAGQAPKGRGVLDYARPFYQRSLARSEIAADIAVITSGMKREHRAPARYGASALAHAVNERAETPPPAPTTTHYNNVAHQPMQHAQQQPPVMARPQPQQPVVAMPFLPAGMMAPRAAMRAMPPAGPGALRAPAQGAPIGYQVAMMPPRFVVQGS